MLRLLRLLLTGVWSIHEHEWEVVDERTTDYYLSHDTANTIPEKTVRTYVYKCKTCGKHRVRRYRV
jgi:predicted SprT family Zn-dependent metalloprotease